MSYFARSNNYENKMIDIQCEIEKLRADLEFHEQKIRIINNETFTHFLYCRLPAIKQRK